MAINPFPDATLLPVLRPQKWDGGEPALRSKLIRTEEPLQHNLWVSFAYSTESKLYTVTKDSLSAHGQTGKAVVMEALKNLDEQNFEWEISSRRADGSAQVLTCTHEFASESILLPEHLVEAQSILNAQEIVLALPVAGSVIAQTAHPTHRSELDQLMLWAHDNYMNAEGRTLTPNLIASRLGQIHSMYCNPLTDQQLREESPALHPSDYNETTCVLTFRAESNDLSLWEIERLRNLLASRKMADGRPISAIRVKATDLTQAQSLTLHLQHLEVEILVSQGNEFVPFIN